MKPIDPRLLRSGRAARGFLGATTLAGALTAGLVVVQAGLVATGVARAVDGVALGPVVTWLIVVIAARAVLAWVVDVLAHRTAGRVKAGLRARVVRKAATDAAHGDSRRRADVLTITGPGLDALDAYFSRYLPQLVLSVVVPVVVLTQLVRTDLTAALTVALTLPLIPVFMVLVGRLTEAANARRFDALQRLAHHFLDVVEGMTTLRSFGRGRAQAALVRETTDHYRVTTMATLRLAFLSSLVLELLATLAVALVAVGVGLRMVDGDLDLRTGLLAILLAPEAYLPLRQVGAQYHASVAGLAAMDGVDEILNTPSPPLGARGQGDVPDGPLRIEVRSLHVQHPGAAHATPNGLAFVAEPAAVTALAGASGAGKSTTLAVLLGLRPPDAGDVVVCGSGADVPMADLDLRQWHSAVAWVRQEPFIARGTVAENVRIGAPHATDGDIALALARAGLDMDPGRRLSGADGLSAGERRRLALARALARSSRVLLLDEPTAGLDDATEATVLRAVREEAERGATVVMVAHRPSAQAAATRVVEFP